MVMHDNGATELISSEDCPLKIRLKLGPSEVRIGTHQLLVCVVHCVMSAAPQDVAKLYIIEAQDAEKIGVSQEV